MVARLVNLHIQMLLHRLNVHCVMVHTGCLSVTNFSNYNLSNAFTMPNKQIVLQFLQSFDKDHTCSKQVCHKCQNKHHTLLHLDSQTQATNNGFLTRNNQSTNTKGVTNANVNTCHTLKGKLGITFY
jgi:hypothetical protein